MRKSLHELYREGWTRLREILSPALTPTQIEICDRLSSYLPTLMSELESMPVTLCHGDFHLANLLWDKSGCPSAVWVIDWQTPEAGPAVLDIAWFLSVGVDKSDLHHVRRDYLPEYHSALVRGGVTNYKYDKLVSDYRYGLLDGLTHTISGFAKQDFGRADWVDLARMFVGRVAAAAEDAGCRKLIS